MRNIKKVFALIIITSLVFILAACGSKATVSTFAIQGEKLVYEESSVEGNQLKIESSDYNIFLVYREGKDKFQTVKAENTSTEIKTAKVAENKNLYKVTITTTVGSGKEVKKLEGSYHVVVKSAAAQDAEKELLAINTSYYKTVVPTNGTEEEIKAAKAKQLAEVEQSLIVLVANEYKLDKTSVELNAVYSNGTVEKVNPDNKDEDLAFQTGDEGITSMKLAYQGKEVSHDVFTYRPSDNKLPIQTPSKLHFNFLSYIWDFVFIIPIGFLMSVFSFGGSFGWGIIFATIIVRTIAWPIYAKTNDLSINMSLAQPELDRVKAKYALRKDPASQQKMQMETMKVMKKYNVNMFGCFMPLLQMPLFLAMYQVVHRVVVPGGMFADKFDLGRKFLGIIDLTVGGDVASYILAAIVGVSMFFLNRLSTKKPSYAKTSVAKTDQAKQTEQTMKMVNIIMIVFMVFASTTSNALALYWIIGNLYAIGQTLFNRKRSEKKYSQRKQEII